MPRQVIVLLFCLVPLIAQANPAPINTSSVISFIVVAFYSLVIESGIITLLLFTSSINIIPSFAALFFVNICVFTFIFMPLQSSYSLWILELSVVAIDAALIKMVMSMKCIQEDNFRTVSWMRSVVCSLVGNAASYFVGAIAQSSPWIDRDYPGGSFK